MASDAAATAATPPQTQGAHAFCTRLRVASRKAHAESDALVNIKLGLTLSDDSVWANGLWVFGQVFFELERQLDQHKGVLGVLDVPGLRRRAAFEADFEHYFGEDWRARPVPPAVQMYINHIRDVANDDPALVGAYIYHLYMGLVSGGQILSKKRDLLSFGLTRGAGATASVKGAAVTSYVGSGTTPGDLYVNLRDAMEAFGANLPPALRERVVQEGVVVFRMNDRIIRTVEGVDDVFRRKLVTWLGVSSVLAGGIYYYFYHTAPAPGA